MASAPGGYAAGDFQWGVDRGFRLVQAEQCWHTSLAPLMAEVRQQMGDGPVYLSFDIDSLDPIWAPGNRDAGSWRSDLHSGAGDRPRLPRPEPDWRRSGRGLAPYDVSGNTSQLAANLLYEMLCVLPGVKYA